jgi:hypothetical protein
MIFLLLKLQQPLPAKDLLSLRTMLAFFYMLLLHLGGQPQWLSTCEHILK